MQKITPFLWFDKEAKEAAAFYTSVFGNGSKVTKTQVLEGTPSGDCDLVDFHIWGYRFQAISAGPVFKKNPSISFFVNFDPSEDTNAKERLDELWKKLSEGGKALMPLDTYPFSERYGWIEDRYGVSWQLILTKPGGEKRPRIIPSLLFVGDKAGKAEEATNFYMSVFKDGKRGTIARYPAGMAPDKEGSVMFTDFALLGQWFAAMDSAHKHDFAFNEGISLIVFCEDQKELDQYWGKLSAVPEAEQCGWLKDRYGVSWQMIPRKLDVLMNDKDKAKAGRVTQAMLQMKKLDIKTLEAAYDD